MEEEDHDETNESIDISTQLICNICDSEFTCIADRNVHIEDHFKSIGCSHCERTFIGDRAYEFHITSGKCKETVEIDRFRCPLCNEKVFNSAELLDSHLLKKHNSIISDDRISCIMCDRSFARLKYLRKHVRELHENATQFNCETCGKQFNRKSNLIEHELIHQKKFLAKCKTCGKSCRTASALKLHQRTHTGEKPYKCEICNQKSYAYNTDLKRHKRSAHGILGTPYPCTLCTKIFYEPKLLRNHTIKVHN